MMMSAPTRQISTLGPDEYEPPPTPCMGYVHKKFARQRADSVRK